MKVAALNNYILEHLRAELGDANVGDADVPAERPPMPYVIVTLRITSGGLGSMWNPDEDRDYVFQVLCVGRSREQVQWMSDKVADALMLPIDATPEGNVQGVSSDSLGAIVKTGDTMFQQADSYRVRAGL